MATVIIVPPKLTLKINQMNTDSKVRINLWSKEILNIIEKYNEFFNEFNFILYECSMEKISFSNNRYIINFLYAYDRYQMEMNIEMPLAMISFSDGKNTKNLIEIFQSNLDSINFYEKLGQLNQTTNDQSVTYSILIKEYIIPLLKNDKSLF